jgi:muramoyltetrapeptide carboxypeptidase
MERRFPRALSAGDVVAVVSPAGGVRDETALERGLQRLRDLGLAPEVLPHARGRLDRPEGSAFAAPDAERLADLQKALADPRYRAVFCTRGGYGSGRLLGRLDLSSLVKDPKPVVGYSDITALLSAILAETGVVGFHGPMVATTEAMDAGEDGWRLQAELLFDARRAPSLPPMGTTPRTIRAGRAEGPLVGGNLTLVQSLIGTDWQLDTRGSILFLEDTDEAPYRVDRMLTHLAQAGVFAGVAGVVLGDFHIEDTPLGSEHPPMLEVLEERLAQLDVPVVRGFPIGHLPRAWTLPVGARARLEGPKGDAPARLELLEPAVKA